MMRAGKRRRRPRPAEQQGPTVADYFKDKLGWKPSTEPFHTTADRECGICHRIKPGIEFDVPITPGRPSLNICRECAAG